MGNELIQYMQNLDKHVGEIILNDTYAILSKMDTAEGQQKRRNCLDLFMEGKRGLKGMQNKCWEMSNFLGALGGDTDSVERGSILKGMEHSWMKRRYGKDEFILDPAMSVLCHAELYERVFEPQVVASIKSSDIANFLMEMWNNTNLPSAENMDNSYESFMQAQKGLRMNDGGIYLLGGKIDDPIHRSEYLFWLNSKTEKVNKIDKIDMHFNHLGK